ncbi:hypothetical protein BKA61DRAFT_577729 [Leptodontidium sp. MPI-SDFR-AT-0119]|nr:hypothetical protein BKA61DRAFT_577729 [Leptodontidium sp. MPI-SDFR-AT-0119]
MAEPPAKKREFNRPVVFTTPGYQTDVRLTVFDQDFHVHSVLLKIHSAFFRKFLDSPDKVPQVTVANLSVSGDISTPAGASRISCSGAPPVFKYHWITEIDGDNSAGWYLTAAKSNNSQANFSTFSGEQLREIAMFNTMMCAIYLKPYTIESCADLLVLTRLADFYCTLSIVSRTLNIAFHTSPTLINQIPQSRCEVFAAAAKLRNELLFREALVWIVGPWGKPTYKNLRDPKLKKVAHRAWTEVCAKIAEVHHLLMIAIASEALGNLIQLEDVEVNKAMNIATRAITRRFKVAVPRYFRKLDLALRKDPNIYSQEPELHKLIKQLRMSKLNLNKGIFEPGKQILVVQDNNGPDDYDEEENSDSDYDEDFENPGMEDHFLCAEIEDEDLPWDINETDF